MKSVLFTKDLGTSNLSYISLSLGKFKVLLNPPEDFWRGWGINKCSQRLHFRPDTAADHNTKVISSWKILNLKPRNNQTKIFLEKDYFLLHLKKCVFYRDDTHSSFGTT